MEGSVEYIEQGSVLHGSATGLMGTRLDLLLCGLPRAKEQALWERLTALARRLDAVFNRFNPDSELSALNEGYISEDQTGPELTEALALAESYKERTGGLFDITAPGRFLNGPRYDFGGFAKGYFVRLAQEILLAEGVGSAYLDFGGSTILGIGNHPAGPAWRVSLLSPRTGIRLAEVELSGRTLSTSGNTVRYSGHVVDPRTGERNCRPVLTTALSADPLEAEVLSTTAMSAGPEDLEALRRAFPQTDINHYEI